MMMYKGVPISKHDIEQLLKDKDRLDWLADRENTIGNVQLPSECVMRNIGSLRDAIDDAMEMKDEDE
jgi:hypothetical protein